MSADRSTSPAKLRARTRAALGHLVGDVLSSRLDALETRLAKSPWLTGRVGPASVPAGRLREVLDRDRALVAAQPASSPPVLVEHSPPADSMATSSDRALPVPAAAPAPVLAPEEGAQEVQREPIRTRTMARLLAAQGYRARAAAIYQALLAEQPDDAGLRAELERVRSQPA